MAQVWEMAVFVDHPCLSLPRAVTVRLRQTLNHLRYMDLEEEHPLAVAWEGVCRYHELKIRCMRRMRRNMPYPLVRLRIIFPRAALWRTVGHSFAVTT